MFLTVVVFILILSVLVLIHEFGHFIVAKKLGVKVEEFGFGFPPKVFGIKKGETLYSINLLPFGGFVKLYGEDEAGGGKIFPSKQNGEENIISEKIQIEEEKIETENTIIREESIKISEITAKGEIRPQAKFPDIKRAFFAKPAWKRALIIIAGVVMNFFLAVGIISFLFASQGVAMPTNNVRIVEVQKNTPAYNAKLMKDDIVLSVNGIKIYDQNKFISETRNNLGKNINIQIKRNDKVINVNLTPRKDYPKGEGPMGVAISNVELKKYKWYEAPFFGTWETAKFSYIIVQGLGSMLFDLVIHGTKPQGVAGPVGVAQLTGQAVSYGWSATLWFMALLSLNLAVLNILPIPALDGGRLFFIVVELITRRKLNPKYEAMAHAIGLILLLALIVFITLQDILRIIAGKSILQP